MNILVLTTIYKDPDDSEDSATTPIVFNFARAWERAGNNVVVIHNFNTFLYPVYLAPTILKNYISNKMGFRTSLNIKQTKEKFYVQEGVKVFRLPILKVIPRCGYSTRRLEKQQKRIEDILRKIEFIPDVILGHAENPQIYQIYYLKQKYTKAATGIVFHGLEYLDRNGFEKWKNIYLKDIDKYGFRSEALHKMAQEKIGFNKKYFLCPSGIADEHIPDEAIVKKSRQVKKFLFVGQLIKRKHVYEILKALSKINNKWISLDIIGEGSEKENLQNAVNEMQLSNVQFLGKQSHELVLEYMRNADCFIMISEKEVFGLVYLEAMSQCCITIASKNEGMQGIIRNGENGYLCSAGNADELARTIIEICKLDKKRLNDIRKNAYETAKNYSEENVAKRYLDNILK